jgi:hypothetical protein
MIKDTPPRPVFHLRPIIRLGLRFCAILVLVALAVAGFDWLNAQISRLQSDHGARAMTGLLIAVLLGYAVLLAIPFVPGIEIGLALLVIAGAQVAPFIYLATVIGLGMAFLVGQYLPLSWLANGLRDLRLTRLAAACDNIAQQDRLTRLAVMQDKLPRWLVPIAVKYRYATVALVINTPGNIAIGGGGGILLAAGVSRLFSTPLMLLVIAVATAPVPLLVWLWGADLVIGLR